jgi:hypothetical protein
VIALPSPNPVLFSQFTTARRQSVRPLHARDATFDARYDNEALFYDVFWGAKAVNGRREIVALGPPLRNLEAGFKDLRIISDGDGTLLPWRTRALDRHMQMFIEAPADANRLRFESSLGSFGVEIPTPSPSPFQGRRVLLTTSKDNDLRWIQDWVRFHRDRHGVDAVLLYDNASTAYSTADVTAALTQISGVVGGVVSWPYKYGPQGLDAKQFWDSDYCQHGVFEHARRHYLVDAHTVINADIDELVLSPSGVSVCDAAAKSAFGIVRYHGRWTIGCNDVSSPQPAEPPRHRDFDTILTRTMTRRFGIIPVDTNRCPAKWTVVPSRCPDGAQWRPHVINGWPAARLSTSAFTYRHFRELSNGWKYKRESRTLFDPRLHERDAGLARAYAQVKWSD